MSADIATIVVVVALTVLRLSVPLLGIWLLGKALRYSLTVLP
jgi:hypothetical protein